MADPIHQFELKPIFRLGRIGNTELVFTNSALYMLAAVAVIVLLTIFATRRGSLVPGRLQAMAEMAYEFVADTVPPGVVDVLEVVQVDEHDGKRCSSTPAAL